MGTTFEVNLPYNVHETFRTNNTAQTKRRGNSQAPRLRPGRFFFYLLELSTGLRFLQ